eukprot:CAMPEP_0184307058 /NCGR_PEP_ID=MMETSP1049-20130417/15897_1 /TAXON_ID=77928 /ORGANISM="Proteomonas sulcata, Strain CCMP704" /LENGTH=254 /DNA_ID=CAMNT_0026619453 /DNA_START=180 /DNA_END=944 /DNA_ORIENTATION=+
MPDMPFSLLSPALGLLLVFRTNTAYDRYAAGRAHWGVIVDLCKDIVRQGCYKFQDLKEKVELGRRVIAFAYVVKRHCRGGSEEAELKQMLTRLLGAAEAKRLMRSRHRPTQALQDIGILLDRQDYMDVVDKQDINRDIQQLAVNAGNCERIYKLPLPLQYTRFTGRWLAVWMGLLPLTLWREFKGSWIMIPGAALISVFFFGIEELGIQIEEPFSILPLETFCASVKASVVEMLNRESSEVKLPGIGPDAEEMP